ncbi:MAG TPA: SRPBCC family protein [Acidimicrobiia bacterium]|nr:SRPBCC family protein [Acidimicrobiia bacterium]
MAQNEITVDAPPSAVWEVLAHPETYEEWVVGNKAIRGQDPNWPAPGTEFQHTVGFGPVAVKDKTVALESVPSKRLVMNVRALPVGHGIVTFELSETGGGTQVRMEECPAGGPAKRIWAVLDPLTRLRNAETLRRLRRCAESRHGTASAS